MEIINTANTESDMQKPVSCKKKHGAVYFYTVFKATEYRKSPQQAAIEHGKSFDASFIVCLESRNTNNPKCPYKSYAAYKNAADFVDHLPHGAGSEDCYHFYELWKVGSPGVLSFDIEWKEYHDPEKDNDDQNTAAVLRNIHSQILQLVQKLTGASDEAIASLALPLITSDCRNEPGYHKKSYHFYYKDLHVANNHIVTLAFYDVLAHQMMLDAQNRFTWTDQDNTRHMYVDFNIATSNRLFRLAYCNKTTGAGKSYLKPIRAHFLSSSGPVDESEITPPPWTDIIGNGPWKKIMMQYTSTIVPDISDISDGFNGFDGSDSCTSYPIEIELSSLLEFIKDQKLPPTHADRLALRHAFMTSTLQSGSKTNALDFHIKPVFNQKIDGDSHSHIHGDSHGDSHSDSHNGWNEKWHERGLLHRMGGIISRAVNETKKGTGASVQNVSGSGCIVLACASKTCIFRGRDHVHNHIKMVVRIEWPVPRVFVSCEDEDCKTIYKHQSERIVLPVSADTWSELGFTAVLVEYIESQSVCMTMIKKLFE
jgi:hypothetical protein